MADNSPLSEPEYRAVLAFGEAMEREKIGVVPITNASGDRDYRDLSNRLTACLRDALRAYRKTVSEMSRD